MFKRSDNIPPGNTDSDIKIIVKIPPLSKQNNALNIFKGREAVSIKMKPKQKKNKGKLPQTALALYIKLYCDRKGSTKTKYHNNLIEATKSWLSLSETEKEQFTTKFKECEQKYKTKFFDQLKNAKPFMKVKDTSFRNIVNTNGDANGVENNEIDDHVEDLNPESDPEVLAVETEPTIDNTDQPTIDTSEHNNEEVTPLLPTPIQLEEHNEDIIETVTDSNDVGPQTILIEPIPPTIKSGQELFNMLNSSNENNNNAWASLQQFEKNRYSRAVSIMKKDYICKYKEYLHSLSPKELFDYYNKTIINYLCCIIRIMPQHQLIEYVSTYC